MIHLQREWSFRTCLHDEKWGQLTLPSAPIIQLSWTGSILHAQCLRKNCTILVQVIKLRYTRCINLPTLRMWSIPGAIKLGWEAAWLGCQMKQRCASAGMQLRSSSSRLPSQTYDWIHPLKTRQLIHIPLFLVTPLNCCTYSNTQAHPFHASQPMTGQNLLWGQTSIPTQRGSPDN